MKLGAQSPNPIVVKDTTVKYHASKYDQPSIILNKYAGINDRRPVPSKIYLNFKCHLRSFEAMSLKVKLNKIYMIKTVTLYCVLRRFPNNDLSQFSTQCIKPSPIFESKNPNPGIPFGRFKMRGDFFDESCFWSIKVK